ncbi:MAG: DMT family transporter [Acidimicrobiia bacterium]
MTWLTVVLALLAAFLFAIAAVAQQRVASTADAHGWRLFLALVKSPRWWAGTVSDNVGYLVQAGALAVGSLLLVQPLLVTMLLFALPLGARYAGRRITRASMWWAASLAVSLAVFLIAGNADPGVDNAPWRDWTVSLAVCGAVVVAGLVIAARPGRPRALGLAMVTGVMFGLVSALTKTVTDQFGDGISELLSSWETYALIAVGVSGFVAQQLAFQAGSLEISFPAATVLEPLTAAVIGMAVLQERIQADGATWILIGVSVLVMVLATAALARAGVPTPPRETAGDTAAPSRSPTTPRT